MNPFENNTVVSLHVHKSGTPTSKRETRDYRRMTIDEAKHLPVSALCPVLSNDGSVRTVKINGRPKLWKLNGKRVEVPVKYGMYEFATFCSDPDGVHVERLLVHVPSEKEKAQVRADEVQRVRRSIARQAKELAKYAEQTVERPSLTKAYCDDMIETLTEDFDRLYALTLEQWNAGDKIDN